jgi:hypothetical protein
MGVQTKKRQQQRINLTDYLAIFAEESCNYTGILKEVSVNGLRVIMCPIGSQLITPPSHLRDDTLSIWRKKKFKIIISENMVNKLYKATFYLTRKSKIYTVTAYPRWQREEKDTMEIGFEIPENSSDWKLFVQQRISDSNS